MPPKKREDIVEGIQKYFLLGGLVLLIVTLFRFAAPFLGTLFIAAVIVTAVYPLKKRIMKKWKRWPDTLVSVILLLLVLLLVVLPVTLFLLSVVSQASDAYVSLSQRISEIITSDRNFLEYFDSYPKIQEWLSGIIEYTPISTEYILSSVGDVVGIISSFLLENTTNVLKNLAIFMVHIVVFLIALFYFIRDGKRMADYVNSLLPMSKKYRDELFSKTYQLMHSIIFGIFGAALAQGFLLGVGLALVGVHNAVFWGALGALMSPVPYVGIALVWMPFAISMLTGQEFGTALFFILWCMLLVTNIDNIVKPYLIGSHSALHPFGVLIVMLGGALAFGFKGLLFGPFLLTVTLAFLHIYKIEYKRVLNVEPRPRKSLSDQVISRIRKQF